MFPRIVVALVAILFFSSVEVRAQKPEPAGLNVPPQQPDLVDLSLGYNYLHLGEAAPESGNLNGVDFSLFFNATSWLALGGDFMADFGSRAQGLGFGNVDIDSRRFIYMFGPRLTVWRTPRFRAFVEALGGGAHAEVELSLRGTAISRTASADDFATAMGAGFDWRFARRFSWRILQADYVGTDLDGQWQNNFRISTALVYSFGRR